jgi:hypothetical protein
MIAPAPNETEYALNATKTIIDPSAGPSKKIRLASKNLARIHLNYQKNVFYFPFGFLFSRPVDFLSSVVLWMARRVPIRSTWNDFWAGEDF